jgi:hypothetical protein
MGNEVFLQSGVTKKSCKSCPKELCACVASACPVGGDHRTRVRDKSSLVIAHHSPALLFRDVQRNQDTFGIFFTSIINTNNAWGIAIESLFTGTILLAIFALKRRSKPVIRQD